MPLMVLVLIIFAVVACGEGFEPMLAVALGADAFAPLKFVVAGWPAAVPEDTEAAGALLEVAGTTGSAGEAGALYSHAAIPIIAITIFKD